KPGVPPAVSFTAVPMDGNHLKGTFENSEGGTFPSATSSCGSEEIGNQIGKAPLQVQALARPCVKRLSALAVHTSPAPSNPSPTRPLAGDAARDGRSVKDPLCAEVAGQATHPRTRTLREEAAPRAC